LSHSLQVSIMSKSSQYPVWKHASATNTDDT
jgi:hypothetical protein